MDAKRELRPRRHLEIEGADNVRDVGGYPTPDGRRTRWKTFLRADSLHRLPPGSQRTLIDYGIRTVIDLRTTSAIEEAPNVFAGSSEVAYYHQDAYGGQPPPKVATPPEPRGNVQRILDNYIGILDHRPSQVRRTLATLASPGTLPAVVHCAGGQDRTGRITALVLGIAGVPAETIAEDYALSARYLVASYNAEQAALDAPSKEYTWERYQQEFCSPDIMLKMLEHLDERYGGVEAYVRSTGMSPGQIESIRTALVD
jgi:protein-tyrosine phosphatase